VALPVPPRGFAHWDYLYACLRYLEHGRAVEAAAACRVAGPAAARRMESCNCRRLGNGWCREGKVRGSDLRLGRESLRTAARQCTDPKERAEVERLLVSLERSIEVGGG
jgi:hypothetical protein